ASDSECVAQICNLQRVRDLKCQHPGMPRRTQFCDTADYKSALRQRVEGNKWHCTTPILASLNRSAVPRQPNPYLMLRRKLIEEASGKYLVGQLTSAMVNPCQRI